MKYLKIFEEYLTDKLRESHSSDNLIKILKSQEMILEIKDRLLDIEDEGYSTHTDFSLAGMEYFVRIHCDDHKFTFENIKKYLEHLIDFMKSNG